MYGRTRCSNYIIVACELETCWVRLVTPTIKRTLTDAAQYLRYTTPHTILDFLTPARPDPLTTDELVNELRPLPRVPHPSHTMADQIQNKFSFSFRGVALPLAHANRAHAAQNRSGVGSSRE